MDARHLNEVCKPGCGAETCSFLMSSMQGWVCAKMSPGFAQIIEGKRAEGTIRAMGDNCKRDPDPTTIPAISEMKL
jgi:hypothetical protein